MEKIYLITQEIKDNFGKKNNETAIENYYTKKYAIKRFNILKWNLNFYNEEKGKYIVTRLYEIKYKEKMDGVNETYKLLKQKIIKLP